MAPFEGSQSISQEAANSLPQFRGRELGVGRHQDLLHRQALFQNQAENEARDGVGLSRAGARFD